MEAMAYTIKQAAEVCGVHEDTIMKAINSGQLRAKYPNRRPVILRSDLELWLSGLPESRAS